MHDRRFSGGITNDHALPRPEAVGRALAAVLALLTVFAPISMDIYLPVLRR